MKWTGRPVAEIWPFEIFPRWRRPPSCRRHLGFVRTVNSAVCLICRPRKPYLRTKHELYRITRCRDMAIRVCWGHMEPHFGGRGGRRGSAMAPFERAMVVSYRLSIVTVALSVTIRSSNVSDAQIFRGSKFRGVPLGADPPCWGCKE